jgi:hypothetical protein
MIPEVTPMKRLILAALVLALAPAAFAQLYKYTDKDGKTVYTDQPPANTDTKQLKVQPGPPPAPAAAPAKTALEKDKELDKGRKESKDSAKKADDEAKRAADAEERCNTAKGNYQVYNDGQRLMKRLPNGERVFLEEAEVAAEKEKARAVMEQACKKA